MGSRGRTLATATCRSSTGATSSPYTRNLHNVSCPDQFDDNRQSKLYHDFSTSLTLNINKPAAQQQLTSLGSKGTTQTKIGHQDQVCSVQVRNECEDVPGPEDNS